MIWQTISAFRWWRQMSLSVLSACFNIRTRTYVNHLLKSLLPWRNLVRWYIILCYAMTDNPADDFRSKAVDTNVLARLFGLLQNRGSDIRQSSIEVITALAKFGRLIYHFCAMWGLMIRQTISTLRWWKQMFLLVFLACFNTRTRTYVSHLSKPLLPWLKSVSWYVILYCARTHDPADNFRFKMVEKNVLARLIGLLQDRNSDILQSSIKAIDSLAKFGGLLYRFILCKDWRSSRRFPLQDGGNGCPCSSYWLASTSVLGHTSVVYRSHFCLGEIR